MSRSRDYLGRRYLLNVPGACGSTIRFRVKGYTAGEAKLVVVSDAGREEAIAFGDFLLWVKRGHVIDITAESVSDSV